MNSIQTLLLANHTVSIGATQAFCGSCTTLTNWLGKHTLELTSLCNDDIPTSTTANAKNNRARTSSSKEERKRVHHALINQCLQLINNAAVALANDEHVDSLVAQLIELALNDSTASICGIGASGGQDGGVVHTNFELCTKFCETALQLTFYTDFTTTMLTSNRESNSSSYNINDSNDNISLHAVTIITNTILQLGSTDTLMLTNQRLQHDLVVLTSLMKVPQQAYNNPEFMLKSTFSTIVRAIAAVKDDLALFITDVLFNVDGYEFYCNSSNNNADNNDNDATNSNNSVSSSNNCHSDLYCMIVTTALQVLTAAVATTAEIAELHAKHNTTTIQTLDSTVDEVVVDEDTLTQQLTMLTTLLFNIITTNGQYLRNINVSIENEINRQQLHAAAVLSAMQLIKLHSFSTTITTSQWHLLGYAIVNAKIEFKTLLLNTLSTTIQTHPIHPKFLTYPCLFVTDDSISASANANPTTISTALGTSLGTSSSANTNIAIAAEKALMFAVQRLRCTHEELCTNLIMEDNADYQQLVDNSMAEAILPYLIHILSYHPQFPESITIETELDRRRMRLVVTIIKMLIRVLLNSTNADVNNLPYMLKQLNKINQQFVDRNDNNNIGLHFISRLTLKILYEQVKTSDNVQEYPTDVFIPRELYRRKPVTTSSSGANADAEIVGKVRNKHKKTKKHKHNVKDVDAMEVDLLDHDIHAAKHNDNDISDSMSNSDNDSGSDSDNSQHRRRNKYTKKSSRKTQHDKQKKEKRKHALPASTSPDAYALEDMILNNAEGTMNKVLEISSKRRNRGFGASPTLKATVKATSKPTRTAKASTNVGIGGDDDTEKQTITATRKKAAATLPVEQPTRVLPSRSSKQQPVNYKEQNESEKEVLEWHEMQGSSQRTSTSTVDSNHHYNSNSKSKNTSTSGNANRLSATRRNVNTNADETSPAEYNNLKVTAMHNTTTSDNDDRAVVVGDKRKRSFASRTNVGTTTAAETVDTGVHASSAASFDDDLFDDHDMIVDNPVKPSITTTSSVSGGMNKKKLRVSDINKIAKTQSVTGSSMNNSASNSSKSISNSTNSNDKAGANAADGVDHNVVVDNAVAVKKSIRDKRRTSSNMQTTHTNITKADNISNHVVKVGRKLRA